MAVQSISSTPGRARSGWGTVATIAALGVSIALGSAIGYFLTFRPLYQLVEAQSWTPTSCVVVSSRIEQGEGTARADIVYRYTVADRVYTASRYNFVPGTTADSSVPAVVAAHPPGTRFECYVDPDDPTRAVINRTHSLWYQIGTPFFAAFGLLPLVIGLVILRSDRRARSVERNLAAAPPAATADARFGHAPASGSGPIVLQPSATPLAKLGIMAFVCLFWNGIVGTFTVVEYFLYFKEDSGWWIMAVFLLLFQVIGVFLIWALVKQVFALANPKPVLTLSRASVPLGGTVAFGWELTGAAHRVSRLTMTLKGCEEARYRRGTDTLTDTHVFFAEPIVDVSHATGIARGSGVIRVPRDSMHTFTATNNKIVWTLEVAGTIARWPDIEETFPITVGPA